MPYRVHRLDLRMTHPEQTLEPFLNNLEGEVVSIIPNVTIQAMWIPKVDFVLIVERTST